MIILSGRVFALALAAEEKTWKVNSFNLHWLGERYYKFYNCHYYGDGFCGFYINKAF